MLRLTLVALLFASTTLAQTVGGPCTGSQAFCAGQAGVTNIILRCNNGVLVAGNCNDNLGEPPAGAVCVQSSGAAGPGGDAQCIINPNGGTGTGTTNTATGTGTASRVGTGTTLSTATTTGGTGSAGTGSAGTGSAGTGSAGTGSAVTGSAGTDSAGTGSVSALGIPTGTYAGPDFTGMAAALHIPGSVGFVAGAMAIAAFF